MAIFNQEVYNLRDLISIDQNGVKIVTQANVIRDTLIKLYKKCYGNDIDVSSQTADGQYITEITLLINNILQLVQHSQDMLDPMKATGKYLDILASYNNISRETAGYSVAQLQVKNVSGSVQNDVDSLRFVDRAGNTWTWTNTLGINGYETQWRVGEVKVLNNVVCDKKGVVNAFKGTKDIEDYEDEDFITNNGDIYQTTTTGWVVCQKIDVNVGSYGESDAELRSRRIASLGANSVSILDGLKSTLLNQEGIRDAAVFNSITSGDISDDGTTCAAHSVYVIVRQDSNVDIDNNIGNIIYNKLTPGILTNATSDTTHGTSGRYEIKKGSALTYTINWKKCKYVEDSYGTTITCNFTVFDGFAEQNKTNIENVIKNYLDNITLDDNTLYANELLFALSNITNAINGRNQFIVKDVTLSDTSSTSEEPILYKEKFLNRSFIDTGLITFNFGEIQTDNTLTLTVTI